MTTLNKKNTNSKNILVLDIETTGLPPTIGFDKYINPKEYNMYNNCRVIEIAYIIYDRNYNEIKRYSTLIKPDGYDINNSYIHGITHNNALTNGIDILNVFDKFLEDLNKYLIKIIVSHNIKFDFNILLSECFRYDRKDLVNYLNNIYKDCTMKTGKNFMRYHKYPKLTELYKYCFGQTFKQEHRALSDVDACAKCYIYMQNNN